MTPRTRYTRLTPGLTEALCTLLREGTELTAAAALLGVGRSSIYRWLAEGREDGAPEIVRDFAASVEAARAEYLRELASVVSRAAITDAKWAAWMLERLDPDTWTPRHRTEVSGPAGSPIRTQAVVSWSDLMAKALAPKRSEPEPEPEPEAWPHPAEPAE